MGPSNPGVAMDFFASTFFVLPRTPGITTSALPVLCSLQFRSSLHYKADKCKPIRKPYSMFTQENKLIYLCRQNGNPSVSCSQWPPLHHRRVHGTVRKDLRKYIKKNKPGPKVPYVSNRGGGHWLTDGRLTHGWLVQDRFPSLILVRGLTSCGMHLKSPYALWFWSDWQTQTSVFS